MSTAFLTHADCLRHVMEGHPERPQRLAAILEQVKHSGLEEEMMPVQANEITREMLEFTHPPAFVADIYAREPKENLNRIDADTYMSVGSLRAARLAAGACVQATNLVLDGKADNAFCAVRPPGHHAELAQAMGFCLFNNVAIAAVSALRRDEIKKVAILDFDVHHCNGTVDIFKDRNEVLVCSTFQENFYPHRYLDYTNSHIVNSPLVAGSGGREFRQAVDNHWVPALKAHHPDIIFISAGFDAHRDDPLGNLNLIEDDYKWVTSLIKSLAGDLSGGKIVSTLEGGYDLKSLANSVQAHLEILVQGTSDYCPSEE